MSRGALIFPQLVEIERIDTNTTRVESGYDDDFREPVLIPATETTPGIPNAGSPRGAIATRYLDAIRLRAQIEVADWDALRQFANGGAARTEVRLVFHYADLEAFDSPLIDPTGAPMLRKGDRLRRILHPRTEELIIEFPDAPGLYAIRVADASFGLSSGTRNLLIVTFQDREQGVES